MSACVCAVGLWGRGGGLGLLAMAMLSPTRHLGNRAIDLTIPKRILLLNVQHDQSGWRMHVATLAPQIRLEVLLCQLFFLLLYCSSISPVPA